MKKVEIAALGDLESSFPASSVQKEEKFKNCSYHSSQVLSVCTRHQILRVNCSKHVLYFKGLIGVKTSVLE